MARVTRVPKSVKAHVCGRGGHEIPAGDPYQWAKPGFRTRTPLVRCMAHPFRPSELTTSMASEPMAAVEEFDDALDSIDATDENALDELTTAVEQLQGACRDYADARQSALDAWENGNSQLEEYAETAETAAGEAEGFEVEEWPGLDDPDDPDADEASEREQFVTEQIEAAREMASGLEF